MNIENAKKLVGQLERLPPEKFRMDEWIDHDEECGTVGCIAGWCSLLNGGPTEDAWDDGRNLVAAFARKHLGLTPSEGTNLFSGLWEEVIDVRHREITLYHATARLKSLIAEAEAS